jgi:hypothetical protein
MTEQTDKLPCKLKDYAPAPELYFDYLINRFYNDTNSNCNCQQSYESFDKVYAYVCISVDNALYQSAQYGNCTGSADEYYCICFVLV